ncbi:MAG: lamin tail domain-containing protein, partial [Tenuifilaceae bacterium]|nr:lamin tail domain-containing protein [Tenuifilaceae bacterium]
MKVKHLLRTTLIAATMLLWSGVGWGQIANHVVISEVYGGGGNSGAQYKNDFIELYNPTSTPVNLDGWSVQYTSATGASWTNITPLTGTIPAYGFFLIQQAAGSGGTLDLPTPDVIGSIAMSGTAGKVALVNTTTALTGANPSADPSVVDFVGFGAIANGYEGSGSSPAPSNTTSIERKAKSTSTAVSLATGGDDEFLGNGWDSNDNSADFVQQSSLSPQNSSSPIENHSPSDIAPPVPTFSPENSATGVAVDVNPTITFDEAIYTSPAGVSVDNDNVESLITFTDGVDPVTFSATITGNVITVVPDAELLNSQSYTLTVAAVEDELGNAMDAPASATFTTIAAALEVTYSVVGDNGTLAATVDAAPITSGDLVDVGSEVIFTATPADGYRVKEWTLNSDVVADNTTNTFTIDDLQEVSAVTVEFEVIPPFYEVTFSVVGDNGTLAATANGDAITSGDEVEEGFEVVFTATPAEDFRVKEWTLNTVVVPDNSTNTFTITGIDAISAVTVEFEAIPEYLVTFTVTDGTDPVEGAIVTVDGTELIATNISGATTVELVDGVYPYTIYAAGLFEKTGEITVSGAVLDVPVELVSLIKEEFDYPVGTLLTDVGYTAHSGGETNSIAVTEASISYPEYASSGIGNEISLLATGQDVNKLFDPQTKDVLYFGLLVNVSSTSTSGDYFFHLSSNPGGAFKGRLWVKEDGDGKIGFGISHGSNTPEYTDFIYDKNSTYLVALKYEFIEGADNDKVAIYINPTVGEVEPSTGWLYSTDSPTDLENIGYYAFRQGSSGNNVNVKVDGVRFSKVFEKVFAVYQSSDATLQTFTLGGLNVLPRTGLLVDDPDTDEGATLYVNDFTGFEGIAIAATDDAASVEVYLNEVLVEEANYSAQVLADGNVVVAVVTAEDGTIAYYKVTITGENRELEITGPALPATYNTADDIEFTWTATNIAHVNIYVVETEVGGEAILLNEEGPVDATLGTYTYTVANGDFGTFTVRIEDATDAAFSRETTEVLTVVDNIHPEGVEFYPEMGDVDVPVSFTLSIKFDEDIEAGTGNITINKVSDDTEVLSFAETDFTINNDMLTIDVSGLAFETEYYILADAGVIKDLSGNETPALDDKTVWTFTTMEEPASDLFISEYIEGSSNNKALELYNPTSSTIDLTQYVIKQANNGNGWGNTSSGPDKRYVLPLTGTLEPGKVLVLANASANPAITAVADYTFAYDNTANGSDG